MRSIKQKIILVSGLCMAIIATVLVVFSVYSTGTTQHIVTEKVSHILETKSKTALTYLLSSCAATVEKALQDNLGNPPKKK